MLKLPFRTRCLLNKPVVLICHITGSSERYYLVSEFHGEIHLYLWILHVSLKILYAYVYVLQNFIRSCVNFFLNI